MGGREYLKSELPTCFRSRASSVEGEKGVGNERISDRMDGRNLESR